MADGDDDDDERGRREWDHGRRPRYMPPESAIAETAYEAGRRAGREEIRNIFMSFGTDLNDGDSRREFMEDLSYLRNARVRGRRLGMIVLTAIGTVIAGALSTFIPSWLHK
jgi:hypothetical protein